MRKYVVLVVLSLFFFSEHALGQLFAPLSDKSFTTQYAYSTSQDTVYVFYDPANAVLHARHSSGTTADFVWSRFNMTTKQFDQVGQDLGKTESTLSLVQSGGYSVAITPLVGTPESDTAWAFIDTFSIASITVNNTCSYLKLRANTAPESYDYYDLYYDLSQLPNLVPVSSKNKLTVTWKKNGADELDYGQVLTLQNDNLPVEDAYYTVDISDVLGKPQTAQTAVIPAIAPLAKFDVSIWNNNTWGSPATDVTGQAPMKLQLTSQSKNCDSIIWTGFNDVNLVYKGGDSLLWNLHRLATDNVYEPAQLVPGKYILRLIAIKESSGCRDTVELKYADVLTSKFNSDLIPNVFTPGGSYPYFKIKNDTTSVRSIRTISVNIFNRWGKQVYTYKGTVDDWTGWDGKTESGADADAGVYYFIFTAEGWDDVSYSGGPYKGFLYLYRNN
jgi:hypothetical protein